MSHMKIFVSSWIINSDSKATLGNKSSNKAKDFFLFKLSRFVRKEGEVGGEQRREGSFFLGPTVIEGNFGY